VSGNETAGYPASPVKIAQIPGATQLSGELTSGELNQKPSSPPFRAVKKTMQSIPAIPRMQPDDNLFI
jgi:hypothetical protein